MNVLMAVLYQEGSWDEIVVNVPNICKCMDYDEINAKAREYFFKSEEYADYDECFGAYVTDEGYDTNATCNCGKLSNRAKLNKIWGILETVNMHFKDEMSDILDEDFDDLLRELAR